MSKNLFNTVWDHHTVRVLGNGQTQLFIGLHLLHEVTSPQAFAMLRKLGLLVRFPQLTFATADHIVPTRLEERVRPLKDDLAEEMLTVIEKNCKDFEIPFFGLEDKVQGIVHVIGPELGLTQPGMTIACGDSHTSTHGAFGSIAFGIGSSQVRDVLATQTLLLNRPKVRKIQVDGALRPGVSAKDIILAIIGKLGVDGGEGFAYEYAGSAIEALDMEGRMTLCNMSIEGGATCGYVCPDEKTLEYLRGRQHTSEEYVQNMQEWWMSIRSADDAEYDDVVTMNAEEIFPQITWGINPSQVTSVNGTIPQDAEKEALEYMDLKPGQQLKGIPIDVVFIGSCTNGRLSDFREAARIVKENRLTVAPNVKALAVPGSKRVQELAEAEGIHTILQEAGFEWRQPGCSMCLAMNPDKLEGRQRCASTSNRNFKGRQGSANGRTFLMSPASAVATAAAGCITDVTELAR